MVASKGDKKFESVEKFFARLKSLKNARSVSMNKGYKSIENFEDKQMDDFFDMVKKDNFLRSLVFGNGARFSNQSVLNKYRKYLGFWYHITIFGDLLSYNPYESSRIKRLEQRMQSILQEAVAWFPKGIFAQIIVNFHGKEEELPLECIGAVEINANGKTKSPEELAEEFRAAIRSYVKKRGSTVDLDIHLRHGNKWSHYPSEELPEIQRGLNNGSFSNNIKIATIKAAPLEGVIKQPKESTFFSDVVNKVLNGDPNEKYTLLHIASGLDLLFGMHPDIEEKCTVAHLYVLAKGVWKFSIGNEYESGMQMLLSKLANSYAAEKYLEEQKILKKQGQMLDLLQQPLEELTDQLNKTHENTQTLRAILYDPHRSLFAVAPQVKKYFEEGRTISFGNVIWKAPHSAGSATPETLKNTIAAIVCEIFGETHHKPQNVHTLYGIAKGILKSKETAFRDLREICEKIILKVDISSLKGEDLKQVFQRLKYILFTPFKDGDVCHLLPLVVIIYEANPGCKVTINGNNGKVTKHLMEDADDDASSVFDRNKLPVPRFSTFLAFLDGVIAYAKNEKKAKLSQVKLTRNSSIELVFSEAVFHVKDSKLKTFKTMKEIILKDTYPLYAGNFQKPFFDFAKMCREIKDKIKTMKKWKEKSKCITCSKRGGMLKLNINLRSSYYAIHLTETKFRFEITKDKER